MHVADKDIIGEFTYAYFHELLRVAKSRYHVALLGDGICGSNLLFMRHDVDVNLEKAAYGLGANRIQTFFRVTFPLIRPGILAGAIFAFIISFDELVITMFISGVRYTLPVRMWMDIRLEISPTISTISTLLIIMSFAAMLSVEWIRRRAERRYH